MTSLTKSVKTKSQNFFNANYKTCQVLSAPELPLQATCDPAVSWELLDFDSLEVVRSPVLDSFDEVHTKVLIFIQKQTQRDPKTQLDFHPKTSKNSCLSYRQAKYFHVCICSTLTESGALKIHYY